MAASAEHVDTHTNSIQEDTFPIKLCLSMFLIPLLIFIFTSAGYKQWKGCSKLSKGALKNIFNISKSAFIKGHTEVVLECVSHFSVDINAVTANDEYSVFHCACISGHYPLIKELIKRGADVNKLSSNGDHPLYLLLASYMNETGYRNETKVIQLILDEGADINQQNDRGFTCLHRCASYGNKELTQFFLDSGASANIKNNYGMFPEKCAMMKSHFDCMSILINARDADEYTPVCDAGSWLATPEYLSSKIHRAFSGKSLNVRRRILKSVKTTPQAAVHVHKINYSFDDGQDIALEMEDMEQNKENNAHSCRSDESLLVSKAYEEFVL